jgi:hypothetical protein
MERAVAVIWETVDRLGRAVALTDEGWAHIRARHGDMVQHQGAIREAIERADEIMRDMTYSHRQVHYRRRPTRPSWLRVVIQYRPIEPSGWSGVVITAHFTNRRPEESLLWPSPSRRR